MPISANTLFHFTRSYDTLVSILNSKFYPRVCVEEQVMPEVFSYKFGIPMVCFCDIPLSQISEHVSKYGEYAIGLKKDWAIRQGISPVLYVHDKSIIPQIIIKELSKINTKGQHQKEEMEHMMFLMQSLMMMKPYEVKKTSGGEAVRYYDEREWRYIPPFKFPSETNFIIDDLISNDLLNEYNRKNEKYGVVFNPDTINYLIVSSEEEVLKLKRELEDIKGDFSHRSVELLTTRILSMERIRQDI